MTFKIGAKDGIAIALGYLSVSFTFGVLCADKGFPVWFAPLISLTNFTGTGQFAGVDLLYIGAPLLELAVTMLIINIRYALMSISLSQRLSQDVKLWQRGLIAFGITDENFAVAVNKPKQVTAPYMAGLIVTSFSGWVGGTVIGSVAGSLLPHSVLTAFGIALYAMFIAIIIPPSTKSLSVLITVLIAAALSCMFRFVPVLNQLGSGWVIIICGVAAALVAAMLFPQKESDAELERHKPAKDTKDKEKSLTAESTEISGKEKSLTAERTEISDKEKSLTAEGTEISDKEKSLTAERTEISGKEKSLTAEKTEISGKEKSLTAEGTEISGKEKSLTAEKTEISGKEKSLTAEGTEIGESAVKPIASKKIRQNSQKSDGEGNHL